MILGTATLWCCGSGDTEWENHAAGSSFTLANYINDPCTRINKLFLSAAVHSYDLGCLIFHMTLRFCQQLLCRVVCTPGEAKKPGDVHSQQILTVLEKRWS